MLGAAFSEIASTEQHANRSKQHLRGAGITTRPEVALLREASNDMVGLLTGPAVSWEGSALLLRSRCSRLSPRLGGQTRLEVSNCCLIGCLQAPSWCRAARCTAVPSSRRVFLGSQVTSRARSEPHTHSRTLYPNLNLA